MIQAPVEKAAAMVSDALGGAPQLVVDTTGGSGGRSSLSVPGLDPDTQLATSSHAAPRMAHSEFLVSICLITLMNREVV